MKKMRMCFPREKTFSDGFQEYILDCKARNLRDGTIHHYQESVKQIYKRIPPNTPISSLNQQTMQKFYIALRDDPNLNEEDIVKILQEYLQYRGGVADDWLFCSVYGKQLTRSSCYHAIWDYCHERGLEQTGVHRFRHTFAKKWATMGGSVVTLQKILGHSSLAITENYLNILTSDLKEDVDKVNIIRSLKQERVRMKA